MIKNSLWTSGIFTTNMLYFVHLIGSKDICLSNKFGLIKSSKLLSIETSSHSVLHKISILNLSSSRLLSTPISNSLILHSNSLIESLIRDQIFYKHSKISSLWLEGFSKIWPKKELNQQEACFST